MALTPELRQRIEEILNSQHVVLFMKGTKDMPSCGFSARVAGILQKLGVEYRDVDILEHEDLRSGMKEYAEWPTFPQLYIDGKLVGGCDIVSEMFKTGELQAMLGVPVTP